MLLIIASQTGSSVVQSRINEAILASPGPVLIIDSADVRRPRAKAAGALHAKAGREWAVCDPLTEPLPDLSLFGALHLTGGDPFRLLRAVRACGLGEAIRDRAETGPFAVIGVSAGAMVLGNDVGHADILCSPGGLTDTTGLGFLRARVMPHMDKAGRVADLMRARVARAPMDEWILLKEGSVLVADQGGPSASPGF